MDDPSGLLPVPPATFHILLAVADEDRHGYAIIQDVAARTNGELKLSAGTLYRSIQRMLEQGLIVEPRERPLPELDDERRRYYRITDFGRAVAEAESRRMVQLLRMARHRGLAPTCAPCPPHPPVLPRGAGPVSVYSHPHRLTHLCRRFPLVYSCHGPRSNTSTASPYPVSTRPLLLRWHTYIFISVHAPRRISTRVSALPAEAGATATVSTLCSGSADLPDPETFPTGDDGAGEAIAEDVDGRAGHVEERVDAEQDGDTFHR